MSNGNSIYNRITELCKQQNIKITPLLNELGISQGSASGWKVGKMPNSIALIKLAIYFAYKYSSALSYVNIQYDFPSSE